MSQISTVAFVFFAAGEVWIVVVAQPDFNSRFQCSYLSVQKFDVSFTCFVNKCRNVIFCVRSNGYLEGHTVY